MEEEIWKNVEGYEKYYQISTLGRVKSIRDGLNRILKSNITSSGYAVVSFCVNGGKDTMSIHRLVAAAFLGRSASGRDFVVDHIDNDKRNNRLDNLQIISFRENMSKDRPEGTSVYTGVYFSKTRNKFRAAITINKKLIHIGFYDVEVDAAEAYKKSLEVFLKNGENAAYEFIEQKRSEVRSGKYQGVYPNTSGPNYYATVMVNGKANRLGTFPSEELANEARVKYIRDNKLRKHPFIR